MPLLWLSLAFIGGVLLGDYFGWSLAAWLVLSASSLVALILILVLRRFPVLNRISTPQWLSGRTTWLSKNVYLPIPLPLLLLVFSLGGVRYTLSTPQIDEHFIAWYNDLGVEYIVEGVVVEPPDTRDQYTNLRVSLENITSLNDSIDIPVGGTLLARVSTGDDWRYGDRIRLQGEPQTPPEGEMFSYRDYLAREGIYSTMAYPVVHLLQHDRGNPVLAWIYNLKRSALELVYRLYPDPEASLLGGILLGDESGIPEEVDRAFKETGTSHIKDVTQ